MTTQWDFEIKMFFDGLRNKNFILFDDCIGVYYKGTENTNDPRIIVYEFGDYRLRDDHYYIQHSPALSTRQLKDIFMVMERHGIDVTKYDLYYEINNQ